MTIKLGVVMDPIATINPKKDSTLAMLAEAEARGWELFYMEQADLYLQDGEAYAHMLPLKVNKSLQDWFSLGEGTTEKLSGLDVVLMRKDPPFNTEYIYSTYILEQAEAAGTLIVNRPQALRDANEKFFSAWFPECTTATLVTSDAKRLKQFLTQHQDIILKPLEGMGGVSIFRVKQDDPNINVIIETMTNNGQQLTMAQRYLPEIVHGDNRILVIDGKPVPYVLSRMLAKGETRANLAAGGYGVGRPINEREKWLCQQIAPTLQKKGLFFVGIDVIGDYVTEINVTSPTCIRELDEQFSLNISALLMDAIESRL